MQAGAEAMGCLSSIQLRRKKERTSWISGSRHAVAAAFREFVVILLLVSTRSFLSGSSNQISPIQYITDRVRTAALTRVVLAV